jgi:hypothetical protein
MTRITWVVAGVGRVRGLPTLCCCTFRFLLLGYETVYISGILPCSGSGVQEAAPKGEGWVSFWLGCPCSRVQPGCQQNKTLFLIGNGYNHGTNGNDTASFMGSNGIVFIACCGEKEGRPGMKKDALSFRMIEDCPSETCG